MLYHVPENFKRQSIVNFDSKVMQRPSNDYTSHGSDIALRNYYILKLYF